MKHWNYLAFIAFLFATTSNVLANPQTDLIQSIRNKQISGVRDALKYPSEIDFKVFDPNEIPGDNIVTLAARMGDFEIMNEVLNYVDLRKDNYTKKNGFTPLSIAAQPNHPRIPRNRPSSKYCRYL